MSAYSFYFLILGVFPHQSSKIMMMHFSPCPGGFHGVIIGVGWRF